MSINALTNVAVSRRDDFRPLGHAPATYGEVSSAAGVPPSPASGGEGPGAAGAPGSIGTGAGGQLPKSDTTNTGLRVLTTYIPTEVRTLYVTFMTVLGPAVTTAGGRQAGHWGVFYGFLIATPVLVWVTFATKVVGAGKPLPGAPRYWPMWEMFAATAAFTAWAFGLPQSPFARFGWFSNEMAGLSVTVVSAGLGLLAPLFVRNALPSGPAAAPGAPPGDPTAPPATTAPSN